MGRSVAIQLAAKGANVVIVSRSVDKLQAGLESIKVRKYQNQPTELNFLLSIVNV